MNPNWLGILSAVLAVAGFFVVYRIAAGLAPRKRIVLSLIVLLAAVPGASFAAYYTRLLPESAWFYGFRSIPGTELLVVFVGVAGGVLATFLPRLLMAFPLFAVIALSIVPFIKPFIGPFPPGAFNDEWDDAVCLQSTASTCGAASVATILKTFGVHATEAELAAAAHSYSGGTEAWYLARAARERGCAVSFEIMEGFAPENGLPAVVGVRLGSMGHFIPVIAREGEKFLVGDPLRGREILSLDELSRRYEFTGFHMRIER